MKNISEVSIQYIKGVGPAKSKLFANLGVKYVEDLFYLFPRRYEDRRNLTPLAQVKMGECQTITGTVCEQVARRSWFTKKHVTEVQLDDGGGRIMCIWFNQPYLDRYFKQGKRVVCYGKVDVYKKRIQMISPEYEVLEPGDDEALSLKRIVPVYPLTRGVTQRYLRKVMKICLDKFDDHLKDELPVALRNKHRLSNLKRSLHNIHFPDDFQQQEHALRRISFEEFYFFQISIILRRLSITRKSGVSHAVTDAQCLKFVNTFVFDLTSAQKRVIQDIRKDMQNTAPMLRLLQGDVGSGKTLVAVFGCRMAFENGYQSCFMAPTSIVARQHYENIQKMTEEGGPLAGMKVALLIGGLKKKDKDQLHEQIANGDVDCVIGTHALITDDVIFESLSFAVIDEQHKFGVRQRALLSEKGMNPDVLIMTATPIPRTLCITLYGDLDVSIIDELPPGRGTVKTSLYSEEKSDDVYTMVKSKVKEGRQAYIVFPIIEESEKLDLKAAKDHFYHFQKETFKDFNLGLVHGQLKRDAINLVMTQFKNGDIDILVATTVVEVGVDVANASVMVIEHAQRFGLAQLHQLRGRIGRGQADGLCLLIGDTTTEEAVQRLDAILSTTDGFKIAQHDLEIRGPGRFFGRHQHGLNELKVANPATQLDILELARKEALELIKGDSKLQKDQHPCILEVVKRRYPDYLANVNAG